jgi:excisionase family DNA binding protein
MNVAQRQESPEDDTLLSPRQAEQLLGVGPRTISRYVAEGRLVALRLPGGHRRFRRTDVLDLLTPEKSA